MSSVVIQRPVRPGTAFSRAHAVFERPRASAPQSPVQLKVIKPARALPAQRTPRAEQPIMPHVERPRPRFGVRRLALMTLAALVALGALAFIVPRDAQAGESLRVSEVSYTLTVKHGQSLWEIAQQVEPERDTRDVMSEIMKINGLTDTALSAGQDLEIPVTNH
ncbi:LysM peptidoglycan-binding domain-containing protein [Rothia sp. ZJ1223]|uniref:LysM peptidoglycan-binding domain-containing protein n=1 Tax=Rothia sp. ZJ1223 TaxID=2811098 RepID=UPI00195BDBE7|nr:LysM peptidoglycan-binding domain-containing protein [Rothia sp. ZJ1223]MBM7051277.1 LysM peptidoglycan-binding domain-containing protein [Rothia sp. ZJ1223]